MANRLANCLAIEYCSHFTPHYTTMLALVLLPNPRQDLFTALGSFAAATGSSIPREQHRWQQNTIFISVTPAGHKSLSSNRSPSRRYTGTTAFLLAQTGDPTGVETGRRVPSHPVIVGINYPPIPRGRKPGPYLCVSGFMFAQELTEGGGTRSRPNSATIAPPRRLGLYGTHIAAEVLAVGATDKS